MKMPQKYSFTSYFSFLMISFTKNFLMAYNLKFGIIAAAAYSALTLLMFYAFGNSMNFSSKFFLDFLLLNLVLYIFLYFPIKKKIYSLDEQRFYYGEGMKSGFGTAFFASIFIIVFTFIFYKYINSDFFNNLKQTAIPEINNTGLDSMRKNSSIKVLIANSSPVTLMLQQFAFTIISGMIASFIIAAFVSKSKSKKENAQ